MKRTHAVAVALAATLAPAMINPALATADQLTAPSASSKPVDIVVQRALSQRGMPYVYGGGDVSGPTNGVRAGSKTSSGNTGMLPGGIGLPRLVPPPGSAVFPGTAISPSGGFAPGATTVGFDSSGLVQYAFAGAGIKMPRTSGDQCSVGRKVPPAQARRGDLICYGPNGSQSVAIYLGNGQMIEGTDPVVTVSAARTTNMTPYLTRIIES